MGDEELTQRVRTLRLEGCSPKQIARVLGLRPAEVVPIVRAIASEEAADAPEPEVAGCWVSPGWSVGLAVVEDKSWPDREGCGMEGSGLVAVLMARERRRRGDAVSVCGWLVDTYCLGVKDALGQRVMDRYLLRRFVGDYFAPFDGEPVAAPIELARSLVWGAIEYARGLGLEPARDFGPTASHLGPPAGPSGIRFGHNGKPLYVQGPYDDPNRIMRTLHEAVGSDNYHFIAELAV